MPSGSRVIVRTNRRRGTHLDIYIYPLRVDAYQTTGLCGNYNLARADDGPNAGRFCTTNCEPHRQALLVLPRCIKCRAL